jgi:hypothetical protein
MRVAKQAGRDISQASKRAMGRMAVYERALPKREGSPEDVAHFVWAQLAPSLRNAKGLQAYRGLQAQQLDDLVTGKVSERLGSEMDAIKALLGVTQREALAASPAGEGIAPGVWVHAADRGNWGMVRSVSDEGASVHFISPGGGQAVVQLPLEELTSQAAVAQQASAILGERLAVSGRPGKVPNVYDLLGHLQKVKVEFDNIPRTIEDVKASMAQLDQLIADPPKYDPKIVEAIHAFSADRRKTLEAAGLLRNAAGADAREGLLMTGLGLEPSGQEAFLGHRLSKVRGGSAPLPTRIGLGRPSLPPGVGSENKLINVKTGRVRASTHVAVEDWNAAQAYKSALQTRDELGRLANRRFDPAGPFDPKTEYLVNPKSHPLPAHWRGRNKLDEIVAQGWDEEAVRKAAQEITDTYMADGEDAVKAMLQQAQKDGVAWTDLRVVKKKVADRYFAQFSTPAKAGPVLGAYDLAVDTAVASIVFARVGYIPKNMVQNLIMSVPHQGVYMFANVPRALQAMTDPGLRFMLEAEVGFSGPTIALGQEVQRLGGSAKKLPHKLAATVGNIADTPPRIAALLHELAALNVIPRLNPVLRAEDVAALREVLTNPKYQQILDTARARSVEAMADFSRLTPAQRRTARRFLIIPGWLWAGSRYPIHFAATHPGRTAAIAYVAAGEPGAPDRLQVNKPVNEYMAEGVPDWAQGFDLGGKDVYRVGSISPVSTPWELFKAVQSRDNKTIGDYTNPMPRAIWNVLNSQVDSPTGTYKTGFGESLQRNAERLVPSYGFARDMVSPNKTSKYYPEDASRGGRLKRELGILPIEINRSPDAPAKKAYRSVFQERNEVAAALIKLDGGTRLAAPLREAFNIKARVYAARRVARRKHPEGGVEYLREAVRGEAIVFLALQGKKPGPKFLASLQTMSSDQLEDVRDQMDWDGRYQATIRDVRAYLKGRGVELVHGN